MMIQKKPLTLAGETIGLGETRNLNLQFSESYLGRSVSIPLRVMRAPEPGPCVLFTGAIHGDELCGIGIVRDLLYDEPPKLLKGTLICVPVVNIYGLEGHSRYLPDRRDLNRSFPGTTTGSLTSRLAYSLFNEVVSLCDYAIDFHSAAVRRTNYPNVRADLRDPGTRALARAFGCELIVDGKGPEGSLRRTAVRRGIPTIILEAGEVWKIEPGVVEIGVRGCLNVLRWLGMIEHKPTEPYFQVTVKKTAWVRAERGGFLGFHAKPGDLVQKDAYLATNYNIFGRERSLLRSPVDGIVLGMTTMPAVKPGEPVYHIATLSEKTFRRVHRKLERARDEVFHNRIQQALSTNITIQEREPDNDRR